MLPPKASSHCRGSSILLGELGLRNSTSIAGGKSRSQLKRREHGAAISQHGRCLKNASPSCAPTTSSKSKQSKAKEVKSKRSQKQRKSKAKEVGGPGGRPRARGPAPPQSYPPIWYMGLGGATNFCELISWPIHLPATLRRTRASIAASSAPERISPFTSSSSMAKRQ